MNYTGDRRSILTLAHELGHGLHGVLAQPLGLFNSSTPLTTAETASVFGEALTFELLLADEDDPRRRLDLLTGRIEDAIATTFRQIAMNRFEHAVHTERREQGELASERIGELWLEAQNALFGDSVSTEGYTPWWSYIPHFTGTPGYVYAYAYGYLFSLAIYRRYLAGGGLDGRAVPRAAPRRRVAVTGGARPARRTRPHRPRHLGERHRRALGRARRGRAARRARSGSGSRPNRRTARAVSVVGKPIAAGYARRDRIISKGVRMRKVVLLAAALVVALGITASSATSAASETGVTARTVTIGGTFPLTGPASLYATIPPAMKAYFSYINSRKGPDGKRGVYGRQIVFKYYDDGYNPANSVQLTRKLVEEDKVFAVVGSLGTAVNEAIRPYLNAQQGAADPQRDRCVGVRGREAVPVDRRLAARVRLRVHGSTARRSPTTARTRRSPSCYQNDDFGKENLDGLKKGLGAKASNIVGAEPYEVTAADVRAQVAKLRATGASIFVIFATPKFTIQSYAIANALKWEPAVIYTTSVSATDAFLTLAKSSGGGDLPNRTYTVQYPRTPPTRPGTTTPR